jgi:hypothetical protein
MQKLGLVPHRPRRFSMFPPGGLCLLYPATLWKANQPGDDRLPRRKLFAQRLPLP